MAAEILATNVLRPPAAWLDSLGQLRPQPSSGLSLLLHADLDAVGAAAPLPPGVVNLHQQGFAGPFFVQVQSVRDLTITDEQRRDRQAGDAESGGRMLKLCLSDGTQQLFGIEYRKIAALSGDTAQGTKLLLHAVTVRRGVLLLTPDCVTVVGGGLGGAAPAAPPPPPVAAGAPQQPAGGGATAAGGASSSSTGPSGTQRNGPAGGCSSQSAGGTSFQGRPPAHAQGRPPAQQAGPGASGGSLFPGGAGPGCSSGQQRWPTAAEQQAARERREDAALFGDEPSPPVAPTRSATGPWPRADGDGPPQKRQSVPAFQPPPQPQHVPRPVPQPVPQQQPMQQTPYSQPGPSHQSWPQPVQPQPAQPPPVQPTPVPPPPVPPPPVPPPPAQPPLVPPPVPPPPAQPLPVHAFERASASPQTSFSPKPPHGAPTPAPSLAGPSCAQTSPAAVSAAAQGPSRSPACSSSSGSLQAPPPTPAPAAAAAGRGTAAARVEAGALSLSAALQWAAQPDAARSASDRLRVATSCQRLSRLVTPRVADVFIYEAEALLMDGPNEHHLPVCVALMERMFGCSAETFNQQLMGTDKPSKKAAKAKAKEINARFNQLDGCFELGLGPQGRLTVYGVPEKPADH